MSARRAFQRVLTLDVETSLNHIKPSTLLFSTTVLGGLLILANEYIVYKIAEPSEKWKREARFHAQYQAPKSTPTFIKNWYRDHGASQQNESL